MNGIAIDYKKTQAIEVINTTIDTPGEYLENRNFYKALVVTAVESDVILFLQAANDEKYRYSPGNAQMFAVPVIGVITKIDLSTQKQIDNAVELLQLAGVEKIFFTSAITGDGVKELMDYLSE
ncbi:Propanediol utilization protein PduV [bioreactor metagenome]|uniref:Propanediol utilization protein PduV n=1 Tax=bioreactor metagenome TaxID=1076179 RepID=A0A645D6D3_9ZZZZ